MMQTFKIEMQSNSFVTVVLRIELYSLHSQECVGLLLYITVVRLELYLISSKSKKQSPFGALAEDFIYHIPYRSPYIVPIIEACNDAYCSRCDCFENNNMDLKGNKLFF